MKRALLGMLILFVSGCANGKKVTVEGEIRLKGFAHDNVVVLIDKKGKRYKVINAKEFNLRELQRSQMVVQAELIQSKKKSYPAMEHIRILSIEKPL